MTASRRMNETNIEKKGKPGIYIHIPFCMRKCNYCAFLSMTANAAARREYTEALLEEIQLQAKAHKLGEIDTVYVGGGTPSFLEIEHMASIIEAVRESFRITDDAELTVEVNPASLGDSEQEVLEKLASYREMGFNRLSMGVQSMDDERLRILGRLHDSATVRRDFGLAREAGFDNINLDIIFSIPGSGTKEVLEDVKAVAELGPEHISYYSLQLEEGTPFFRLWEEGLLEEVSDEVDRENYHRGCELLKSYGYEHYEISNFAVPGKESRHNSKYWSMTEYLGLGLGASSFIDGMRLVNTPDLENYRDRLKAGELPVTEVNRNTMRDNISEAIFTGLRRSCGIKYENIFEGWDRAGFEEYYKDSLPHLQSFVNSGHLIIDDKGLRLTEQGTDISNRIMAEFV